MRITVIVCAVVLFTSPAGLTARQGAFPPASFSNLQVLPKDSGPAVVVGTMKGFTQALGVRCQHCHEGEEGMPLEKFDFTTDAKRTKVVARSMMRLVNEINASLDREVPASAPGARVSCTTCHNGSTAPKK